MCTGERTLAECMVQRPHLLLPRFWLALKRSDDADLAQLLVLLDKCRASIEPLCFQLDFLYPIVHECAGQLTVNYTDAR